MRARRQPWRLVPHHAILVAHRMRGAQPTRLPRALRGRARLLPRAGSRSGDRRRERRVLAATMTERADIVGRGVFDVFPDNPDDPATEGVRNLGPRSARVRARRAWRRHGGPEVRRPASGGRGRRLRGALLEPVQLARARARRTVAYIIHQVEDVTDLVRLRRDADEAAQICTASTPWRPRSSGVPARLWTPAASSRRPTRSWPTSTPGHRSSTDLKTQFFANVSHELRTPLALILAPAERVLADLGPDDPHRSQLEVIVRNAACSSARQRPARRRQARSGRARAPVHRGRPVPRGRFVANSFETLAPTAPSTSPSSPPATPLRPGRPGTAAARAAEPALQRVQVHLRRRDVRIELHGDDRGRHGSIEVADSGPGIAPERRARGLRALPPARRRRDAERRRHRPGAAHRTELVDLHGGSIEIGDAPEGGALFVVELPVVAPRGTTVRPEDGRRSRGPRRRSPARPAPGPPRLQPHRRRRATTPRSSSWSRTTRT